MFTGNITKRSTHYRTRVTQSMAIQLSTLLSQTEENGNLPEAKKILGSAAALKVCPTPSSFLGHAKIVGIIGGASVISTLIFLEKLVWWSTKNGGESVPFIVCSDPDISRKLQLHSSAHSGKDGTHLKDRTIIENLRRKISFLELSGARCIVMPCHVSHVWHDEVSIGCSVSFLNVGDSVAREIREAKHKPLEAGSKVRIGVLALERILMAGFYQEKLQNQGFEVVLPDRPTMEHIIIPAVEALNQKDIEGARNLLRIAVQLLLVRAVNVVILASDEFHGLLPHNDPLLKKCIDPMDALARSTILWARTNENKA
ncbi:hypothetical protein RJ640_018097 [Escallonia rubra]|uniref:Aspartate racemase n=1 Tax=Escallonia rubra TaxID=112253 RepID=A0AA88U2H4_9ASTE|nr:hypothetical protein RJ640_018097 [Escallonia rubra]